jgi:hypothetical protein
VRGTVKPHLYNVLTAEITGWKDILAAEGLHGRYLKTTFPEQEQP